MILFSATDTIYRSCKIPCNTLKGFMGKDFISFFVSCHLLYHSGEALKHHVLSLCPCDPDENEEIIVNTPAAGFIAM